MDAHAGHRRSGRLLSGVPGLDNSLQVQPVTIALYKFNNTQLDLNLANKMVNQELKFLIL